MIGIERLQFLWNKKSILSYQNAVKPDFTAPLSGLPAHVQSCGAAGPSDRPHRQGPYCRAGDRSDLFCQGPVYLHPQVRAAEYSLRGTGDAPAA